MTSQKDQIQSLIAEIESTLNRAAPRLLWARSGETNQQRQTLEKARNYLRSLQQTFEGPGGWGPLDPNTGQIAGQSALTHGETKGGATQEESAAQILQGLLLEMQYLKENSLKPLRLELASLKQQREVLQAEIKVLEVARSETTGRTDQHLNTFLEVLIDRLQTQLSEQVAATLAKLEADRANELLLAAANREALAGTELTRLHPAERLDRLRLLQSQSDQLLLKLDSTLETVFESLQKSVESYRDSLATGLDQMHSLGRQGEVIFHSLVNHLAQQLGQDASLYLNSELDSEAVKLLGQHPDQLSPVVADQASFAAPQDSPDDLDLALAELHLEDIALSDDESELTMIQVEPLVQPAMITPGQSIEAVLDQDFELPLLELDDFTSLAEPTGDDEAVLLATQPDSAPLGEDFSFIAADVAAAEAAADSLALFAPETEPFAVTPMADDESNEDFYGSMFGESTEVPEMASEAEPGVAGDLNTNFTLGDWSTDLTDSDLPLPLSAMVAEHEVESAPMAGASDSGANLPTDLAQETVAELEMEALVAAEDAEAWLFDEYAGSPEETVPDLEGRAAIESDEIDLEAAAPSAAVAHEGIDELFGDGLSADPDLLLEAEPEAETIESLTALLPDDEGSTVAGSGDESLAGFDIDDISLEGREDIYVSAPIGENLLDVDESEGDHLLPLDLDDLLMEQLDEDLPSLDDPQLGNLDVLTVPNLAVDADLEADLDDLDELTFDQAALESLVADFDLDDDDDITTAADLEAEAAFLEPDLNELAAALLGTEATASKSGADQSADHRTASDGLALSEAEMADLSLDDFMPDSSELPDLEPMVFEGEAETVAADFEWDGQQDALRSPEATIAPLDDLSLEALTASLGWSDEAAGSPTAGHDSASDLSLEAPLTLADFELPTLNSGDEATEESGVPLGESEVEIVTPSDLPELGDGLEVAGLEVAGTGADTWEAVDLSDSLLDELAALSQVADQQAEQWQRERPLGALYSDLEEPMVSTNLLLPIPELAAATPILESALMPDVLTDADSMAASGDADSGEKSPPLPALSWFLGIDLGTTGLSAVLLERQSGQVFPIYWLEQTAGEPEKRFRLPTWVWQTAENEILAVGQAALQMAHHQEQPQGAGVLLKQLKPLMKIAIPHEVSPQSSEPLVQWSDGVALPLGQVQLALTKLLQRLSQSVAGTAEGWGAVGLEVAELEQAFSQLQAVIVGYPTNWPDTYSFNLREVVLASGLVTMADQVFFIEDAIATVLSGLPDPSVTLANQTTALSRQPSLYNCDWQGGTVVISAGAGLSELAVVDLPASLSELTYDHFSLRSFPYAGDALDQDIICQLLYPPETRQTLATPVFSGSAQGWHWQAELPSWAAVDWQSLQLESLTLPEAGESDLENRHRLQQRLESSPLGQSLLEAARYLKLILQHQSQFQLDLGSQRWLIKRRDLESRIFLPYIQRINRHLNVLLSHKGLSAQAIKQVLCTGGSASLPAIARWLRQKFPNATIIQDTYAGDRPNSCSRVAYGLVNLARYPQVLDINRQQYNDYFLLMELLRVFPSQPLPVSGIMHLLEQRGINTQACQLHILALLEGHLPPGLIPTPSDRAFISPQSTEWVTYQALTEAPLFARETGQSGQIYVPNEVQCRRLRAYLEMLMAHKQQTLDEPLIAQLAAVAVV